jgi:guanine deaminase
MTRSAIKGHVAYTPDSTGFVIYPDHFLLIDEDHVVGLSEQLPDEFRDAEIHNFGDCLVIPGLNDLHIHAAQYGYRGLGMDMALLPWLETYAFPEESKFADAGYAAQVYMQFAQDLASSATTRAIVWGTIHATTDLLVDELVHLGLGGWVGKINMDRNSAAALTETTAQSVADSWGFIQRNQGKSKQLMPAITPRFIPSCSDELMMQLGQMSAQHHIPITSHLSENRDEITWVQELIPESPTYAEAYDKFQLFGQAEPCVMAHCVYPEPSDYTLLANRKVTIAHCPSSNLNVLSGLAPVRRLMDAGISVGLGTDVAGGHSMSLFDAMVDAIRVSKMYTMNIDSKASPLKVCEAFYLGTKGGGQVFGQVGSFEPGWTADVIVFDDSTIGGGNHFSLEQRLERLIYLHQGATLKAKFLAGQKVL